MRSMSLLDCRPLGAMTRLPVVSAACLAVAVAWCCPATMVWGAEGAKLPYQDDEAIVRQLQQLKPGGSTLLPKLNVPLGDEEIPGIHSGMRKVGPGQRDYCNRMPYAVDRQTALYAGGNHQVPNRMNDVWEYHLGSNTWHLLYAPDGGNPSPHKGAYFLTSRNLAKDPNAKLDDNQRKQIEEYRKWWQANVVLQDGHLTTRRGGPIMPAHTWDALTYDAGIGKLIWGMGANPAGQFSTYAYFAGESLEAAEKLKDANYTGMWMFDPREKRWSEYRTSAPRAALRGMGASLTYLPDLKRDLWYVAATNVSPPAYEMWLFDAAADQWTELQPNGGQSISRLVTQEKIAPESEQQMAYSPRHKKLVAVLKHDTFVYDVAANRWSKAATDKRIFGHDAHSVFAYDEQADAFLLAFPPEGRGKQLQLAAFSLATNRWEIVEPAGPAIPATKYGSYTGYYDPQHNVLVVQGRNNDQMWVYRHGGQ